MFKKSLDCENCGAHIEISKNYNDWNNTIEGICPFCGTKYIISNTNNNIGYEYETFTVSKEYVDQTMEELKLFHYEYVSSTNMDTNNDCVMLKVKRKKEFKNRDKIVKLESEYKNLRIRVDETIEQMQQIFPKDFCVVSCIMIPSIFSWYSIIIFIEMGAIFGLISTVIELSLIISIVVLISKKIYNERKEKYEEYLEGYIPKIDKIFEELEELNKEEN